MRIRAAVAEGRSQPLVIEELELDQPREDEVLVRLVATGICQTDAHAWHQRIPVALPHVLGHEGAGVVERVGASVDGLEPGDHVVLSFQSCGRCEPCLGGHPAYCDKAFAANFSGARLDGSRGLRRTRGAGTGVNAHFFGQSSFATHALTSASNTVKVTKDAPLEQLAPLGCGLQTGAGAVLNSFALPAGASIAVLGTGAVGFGALMAAGVACAAKIIAVDVHAERLALAQELGATHVVDARQEDVTAAIRAVAARGVDFVLDTTGRPEMLGHAIASLAPMGRVGLVAGGSPEAVVPVAELALGKSVAGIVQGDAVPQRFIPQLVELFRSGRFPVDRLVRFYDFDDINTAFADAARGDVIKPVLRIADPLG
ncbi:NAD(P)-dependent alcohol dehydrogenase [Streptomyces chromofuscus]|uniref:NAD(P)-dependent alcohol dehydrogenase n=1 Tax=Streptomyces chromofuscus TaxID=42881 RepID=A0A7M2T804_STRCW|nr:NAD(P)-dependent alcohol dehydrogenase [Streptomyces chromofuscus]QOV43828.1 NAD(P)-dependent alcohol dehydrogenase [Streptomyces chromofuscus]GGT21533.1 alcohol dehydrogenase [Streptomyces chromofuscus]